MSSLFRVSRLCYSYLHPQGNTYKLDDVARSICSSNALLVEDPNQPAMVLLGNVSMSRDALSYPVYPGYMR